MQIKMNKEKTEAFGPEDTFAARQMASGYELEPYIGKNEQGTPIFAARWVKKS